MTGARNVPIRQHTPRPLVPPDSRFTRRCVTCGSGFLNLAPGKTGERGIWREWSWFCSAECAPEPVENHHAK